MSKGRSGISHKHVPGVLYVGSSLVRDMGMDGVEIYVCRVDDGKT